MDNDSAFHFLNAIPQLLLLDLLLSGDNAILIALACRSLAPQQMRRAMLMGIGGAIVLRLLMATIVGLLMSIPLLKLTGGVVLVVIAIRLLLTQVADADSDPDSGPDANPAQAATALWPAVGTIVVADLVMSLDNVVGLAAVAQGNVLLLALGLLASMPMLMFGSLYVTALLKRHPMLVRAGGAMLGWIAGDIAVSDPVFAATVNQQSPALTVVVPVLVAIYVLYQSRIIEQRRPALAALRPMRRQREDIPAVRPMAWPESVQPAAPQARVAAPPQPAPAAPPGAPPPRRRMALLRSRWVPAVAALVLAGIGFDLVSRISLPSPTQLDRYDCTGTGTTVYFRNGAERVRLSTGAAYANGVPRPDHQVEWGDYHAAAVALGVAPPTHIQGADGHAIVLDGGGFARVECVRHAGG